MFLETDQNWRLIFGIDLSRSVAKTLTSCLISDATSYVIVGINDVKAGLPISIQLSIKFSYN
jgi:hypothetical protein